MILFHVIVVAAATPTADYLTPVILTVGTVLVAGLGVFGAVYRRRQDAADAAASRESAKELSEKEEFDVVKQARDEATRYYTLHVSFRDLFYSVRDALKHLVRLIQHHHPDMELPPDVMQAVQVQPPDVPSARRTDKPA